MKKIDNKKILKEDWKNFIKWSKTYPILFGNNNFYSNLFSINSIKLEENIIEFFIYDNLILNKKYSINLPSFFKKTDSKLKVLDVEDLLRNLFNEWFLEFNYEFSILFEFLMMIKENKYTRKELLNKYWKFMELIKNKNIESYSNWIRYINLNINLKERS
ncbi:MAG: hypothetical protein TYPL_2450 [Candidatus Tyloplasma litorale]|nr:MAG: hypothetical protein TYPL_2450 [Mycoplasmatales bacterium]